MFIPMQDKQNWLRRAWTRLNPVEPSPLFLLKFMAIAVALIVGAYFVGELIAAPA